MFTYHFYQIITRSYTHVGQGAADTGVIDNLIQREQPYGIPVMHASSLKGAFRIHFKEILGFKESDVNFLFGSEEAETDISYGVTKRKMSQAAISIHDAKLLFLPVGALYEKPYYFATSDYVLKSFFSLYNELADTKKSNNLDIPDQGSGFYCFHDNPIPSINPLIEGINGSFKEKPADFLNQKLLGVKHSDIAMFEDVLFRDLCKFCIPVIERNRISYKGISENKFNEEVLPVETGFWFFISIPKGLSEVGIITNFLTSLTKKYIQIGANSSLSQGLCEIKEMKHASE